MCPFELTATPVASPKFMSGGSLMKFGTESNLSSGADVDCAIAEVESRPNRTVNQDFIRDLPLCGGLVGTNFRLAAVYKRKGLRHNHRGPQLRRLSRRLRPGWRKRDRNQPVVRPACGWYKLAARTGAGKWTCGARSLQYWGSSPRSWPRARAPTTLPISTSGNASI